MENTRRYCPGVRWVAVMMLSVLLTFTSWPVMGATPSPWPALRDQQDESSAILMNMAKYIAGLSSFSMEIRSGYDAIQEGGQRIEFGARRQVILERPDKLRVETEQSDGDPGLVVFDGKDLVAFKADENIFAKVEKPGTVDQVLVYLVRDLKFTLPLARMLHSNFPGQIEKRLALAKVSYVEENTLFDVPTDHLAVRLEDVDLQLWIAQGNQPLPRRVIFTYKNVPGEPQFRADFLKWNVGSDVSDDLFAFTPPADAEQVPLLAPVRRTEPQGGK